MMAINHNALAITVSLIVLYRLIHSTRASGARAFRGHLPKWDLPARLVVSTSMVLAITAFASKLGPELSGILSPIPVIAWPLIVFAHMQGGRSEAVAAIRGTAAGSIGIIVFYIAISQLITGNNIAMIYLLAFSVSVFSSFAFSAALNQRAVSSG
jgi:hypothetical protein